MAEKGKKRYHPPELKKWGSVADLTKTGFTHFGQDAKTGSVGWSKGQ